jgi:Domain of unknown function (DUF5664)
VSEWIANPILCKGDCQNGRSVCIPRSKVFICTSCGLLSADAGYESEQDPNGLDAHTPGAKLDAGKVRLGLVLEGFSKALIAVGEVGTYGANKYTADGWKKVPNGFERYTDALYRHLLTDECLPIARDEQSGIPHAAHAAWNALARLELLLSAELE